MFAAHLYHLSAHNDTTGKTSAPIRAEHYLEAKDMLAPFPSLYLRIAYKPPHTERVQSSISLARNKKLPGFFFWSAVVNPVEESVIVWDSGTGNVQCRHMQNLTINW
jgi:hypothetical protein